MKNFLYLVLLVGLSVNLSSCNDDFLGETYVTDLDLDAIFSDSTYTVGFVYEIYRDIGFAADFRRFSDTAFPFNTYGGLQTTCTEGAYRAMNENTADIQFVLGTISPFTVKEYGGWKKCYENIRRCNMFLANIHRAPLEEFRKTNYKGEARFLRAWYYAQLLWHYGGIPLIGDDLYEATDHIKTKRDTYVDCVKYIVNECDQAATEVIAKPVEGNLGRVGQAACEALKCRVLLYAASALHNGSNYVVQKGIENPALAGVLGYPDKDNERWRLAMESAKKIIDSKDGDGNPVYSLSRSHTDRIGNSDPGFGFYMLFLAKEFLGVGNGSQAGNILDLGLGDGLDRERSFNPPSRGGGAGGYPYQEFVDAFPMKDGSPFDWNNPEHAAAPYENRDPRFYNSIVYDGVLMRDGNSLNIPVNIYSTAQGKPVGQDGVPSGTATGYYFRKMLSRETAANYVGQTTMARPLIRYAEILLNYAEARNEYLGGPDEEVYDMLFQIRERAGIEKGSGEDVQYGLKFKPKMTYEEMRDAIRLERELELAVEGHRFFDVRRWMIAPQTENRTMTGMEVIRSGNNVTYRRFEARHHRFTETMYFWPLPYDEVGAADDMEQNPGYN